MRKIRFLLRLMLGACFIVHVTAQASEDTSFLQDPADIDRTSPPGLVPLQLPSGGVMMNGHLYTADGPGPHPTVILLHGFPGYEKNLDLAQMLRRAGFNVLFFHYRGAWGSGGDYRLKHALEDAEAAVTFVRTSGQAGAYKIDPDRTNLVGHSLGGFISLMTGARDTGIRCTVAAAPLDMVRFAQNADRQTAGVAKAETPIPGLKNYSFTELMSETLADQPRFDLQPKMADFKDRPLMIVSGDKDKVVPIGHQISLAGSAQAAGANNPFTHVVLDGDHGFSWSRVAFITAVTHWMIRNCM